MTEITSTSDSHTRRVRICYPVDAAEIHLIEPMEHTTTRETNCRRFPTSATQQAKGHRMRRLTFTSRSSDYYHYPK